MSRRVMASRATSARRLLTTLLGVAALLPPRTVSGQGAAENLDLEVGIGLMKPARDLGTIQGVMARLRSAPLLAIRGSIGRPDGLVGGRVSGLLALNEGISWRQEECTTPCVEDKVDAGHFFAAATEMIIRPWGDPGPYVGVGLGVRRYSLQQSGDCAGPCPGVPVAHFRQNNSNLAVPLSLGFVLVAGKTRLMFEVTDVLSRYKASEDRFMHDVVITLGVSLRSLSNRSSRLEGENQGSSRSLLPWFH